MKENLLSSFRDLRDYRHLSC